MNKSDFIFFGIALCFALSMRCNNDHGDAATFAIQPPTEIIVAGDNQTIGSLLVTLERRAVGATGLVKPRHAAPPMPKSYPIRSPPKPSPKPKPKKK